MSLKDGRCVARPLQNLGSTCFVNCVLQALAHAPELCMAVDTETHSAVCPIAAENASNRRLSPSSTASVDDPLTGSRRSSRKSKGGRKSPSSNSDQESNSVDHKYCVLCELEHHFQSVHDLTQKDKPFAPSTFVNGFFEHVAPWFKLGVQEDAHEFLRLLIDAMQKSCQQARLQDNPQDDASKDPQQPPVSSISISTATASKDDKEYPFSLFRGMVESKVNCAACQASSATLDPIEDVGLEVSLEQYAGDSSRASRNSSPLLSHSANLSDVQSAFQRFARVEQVDGYKCEKCGCTGRATKQSRLASIPPILTLHLKRFRYGDSRLVVPTAVSTQISSLTGGGIASSVSTRSSRSAGRSEVNQLLNTNQDFVLGGKSGSAKIEGHVKFDLFFDLKPYLTQELQTKEKSMFCRLFAVIVHAGKNSHSGHYIAYVQSLNKNEWWKMDDGRVTLVDKSDVLQAEAYMLFYRVIQHPVALAFNQAYERKLEERNQRQQAVEERFNMAVADSKSKRKRFQSSFRDGEEWARAKAPRVVGVATKSQEMVAEALELTNDFLQRIGEEASQEDAREGHGPTSVTIDEQDVVGGVSKIRQQLAELFYRLAQHFDDGDATATATNNATGGATTVIKPTFFDSSNNNSAASTVSNHSNKKAPTKMVEPLNSKSGVVVDLVDDAVDVL